MSRFAVVYDACVLYPAPLRDLLITLARTGLFRAQWTDEIHEEWIRNLLANRPDLTRAKLDRTRALMDAAVRDPLITGYHGLISSLSLPDEDDRHVLAAAIVARADAIVTKNLRDFPESSLAPYRIEAIHPDDFLVHQISRDAPTVCAAVKERREQLRNPPKSVEEYLDTLEKQELPRTVAELRKYASLL